MGKFNELLHPRGKRGRFVVQLTGSTQRDPSGRNKDTAHLGKRVWRSEAQATTSIHRSPTERRVTSIRKWEAGVTFRDGQYRDARVSYRYSKGRLGPVQPHPRGGTHRPLLEVAGWKQTGIKVMPRGYYNEQERKQESALAALKKPRKR